MANILELMGHVQQQGQLGKQQGQQTRLGQLAGQAYTAPTAGRSGILSQIAAIDPRAAQSQQQQFRTGDADRVTQFTQKAKLFAGMARSGNQQAVAGMYPQLAKEASELFGMQVPGEYDPSFLPGIEKMATLGADAAQEEQFTLAPGSARYGPDGKLLVQQPFAPAKPEYQMYESADGPVWLPKPTGDAPQGAGQPFSGMGTPGQPPVTGAPALDPTQDFPRLASAVPGVQNTSLFRDAKNNARVGGVANSQHKDGTAGDFVVPAAQRQQFMQQARSMGYEAIDEGDHVHLELPPGRQAANRFTAGQGLNAIPVGGVRPKQKADDKPSALQERLELARGMGASPEQLQAIVMGDSSTKGPSAAEQKDALARRAKQPQVANAVRGLGRIENAVKALSGGLVNTGPVDQYATRYTKAGQELEAAVGGIQNSLLSLTRVPGIGSQSDLEARIANMQYPSLDKDPEVNARTVENLKAFIADLQEAYQLADAPAAGSGDKKGGSDIDSLLDLYK